MRKEADSMTATQYSLPGQSVGLGLLGVNRQESMADSHTEIFPGGAVHCMAYLAFTQISSSPDIPEFVVKVPLPY